MWPRAPYAAMHTRDARGSMRKRWASRWSHVSPCNPGQHGPRWARIRMKKLGALPVMCPGRHGCVCARPAGVIEIGGL